MSEYIVEMKHITKRFPGIVANDDVTIQIKKGEIFALLECMSRMKERSISGEKR